jgi:hypothetical protein
MKLDGKLLKKLILEVIEEGRQEKKWIAQQPEGEQEQWLSAEQQGLKLSDLAWIKKVRGGEPIQDIVGDVLYFRNKKTQQILKSNNLETNLSKKTYPTVNDLRRTLQKISAANKPDVQYVLKDPSQVEFLGKVGNWEILMPLTQRGSVACDISGKDTTWCTQRKSGQNLFYSYVGRKNEDIILFYVMDYSRTPNLEGKDADARLSIGFLNGKPVLKGQGGGLSVDAENEGLTEDSLQNYLRSDYSEIMNILQTKAEEVGSKHPAKEMLKKAAQNVILLKKLVKDYKEEEKKDFYKQILKQDEISPKVFYFLAKDKDADLRKEVAMNLKTSPETLLFLAKDKDAYVRKEVARNPNTPTEALVFLARDGDADVRVVASMNSGTPPETLASAYLDKLFGWDDFFYGKSINFKSGFTTRQKKILDAITKLKKEREEETARKNSAYRQSTSPSTDAETLRSISNDKRPRVRRNVARHKNTPIDVLKVLANDEERIVSKAATIALKKRNK